MPDTLGIHTREGDAIELEPQAGDGVKMRLLAFPSMTDDGAILFRRDTVKAIVRFLTAYLADTEAPLTNEDEGCQRPKRKRRGGGA